MGLLSASVLAQAWVAARHACHAAVWWGGSAPVWEDSWDGEGHPSVWELLVLAVGLAN